MKNNIEFREEVYEKVKLYTEKRSRIKNAAFRISAMAAAFVIIASVALGLPGRLLNSGKSEAIPYETSTAAPEDTYFDRYNAQSKTDGLSDYTVAGEIPSEELTSYASSTRPETCAPTAEEGDVNDTGVFGAYCVPGMTESDYTKTDYTGSVIIDNENALEKYRNIFISAGSPAAADILKERYGKGDAVVIIAFTAAEDADYGSYRVSTMLDGDKLTVTLPDTEKGRKTYYFMLICEKVYDVEVVR